ALRRPRLRRAINATGVIVHTNLGRAPLAEAALDRVQEVGRGYSNLEYDLSSGTRGSRQDHVSDLLRRLTGAEAALVVNNDATGSRSWTTSARASWPSSRTSPPQSRASPTAPTSCASRATSCSAGRRPGSSPAAPTWSSASDAIRSSARSAPTS